MTHSRIVLTRHIAGEVTVPERAGSMALWRRLSALSGGLVLAFAVTACGGGASAPAGGAAPTASGPAAGGPGVSTGDSAEHNDADVRFAQDMIVHHRGALVMADLARERAQHPDVQALVGRISAAQEPEIATMSSWLQAWGEDVPEGSGEGSGDGGHGGGGDPAGHGGGMATGGMDTEASMTELEALPAGEFDHVFLELMTEHHRGAVAMAQREQGEGQHPDALDLAEQIAASQTQEIQEMRKLLASV